jgi:hypothetical protein
MTRLFLLTALAGFTSGMAAAQTSEPTDALESAAICPGLAARIPLGPRDATHLDLTPETTALDFDGAARLCADAGSVTLRGHTLKTIACEDVLDSPDDGLGEVFLAEAARFELWLYIDPARRPRVLEVGLSRDDAELVWIDTGWSICNG